MHVLFELWPAAWCQPASMRTAENHGCRCLSLPYSPRRLVSLAQPEAAAALRLAPKCCGTQVLNSSNKCKVSGGASLVMPRSPTRLRKWSPNSFATIHPLTLLPLYLP